MISTIDIAWAAGILEGEGSFLSYKGSSGHPVLQIKCSMQDQDVIWDLHGIFKLGTLSGPSKTGMYTWYVSKVRDVVSILMTIYPLMRERRQEKISECLRVWREEFKHNGRKVHRELVPSILSAAGMYVPFPSECLLGDIHAI